MKILKYIMFTIAIIVLAGGGFAAYQYHHFKQSIEKMSDSEIASPETDIVNESFSILLLGVDEREGDVGRSDTMIVLTVNPADGSMKMLSIPRDTRTEIVGHGTVEKINHAYAYGGVKMSMDTVENFLNIPIDYYATVNMESFSQVIDMLGGVTVENDMDLKAGGYTFPKGEVTLSGKKALVYSRIRHEDPRGDFGRQTRQRLIIEAVMEKAKTPKTLLNVSDIIEIAGDNIKTNMTFDDISSFPSLYSKVGSSIEQLQFENGTGETIDGLWYYIMDDAEVQEISAELNAHLNK